MSDRAAEETASGPLSLPQRIATWVFYAVALVFFVYLVRYYLTGAGGPSELAVTMVPVAIGLVYLNDARNGHLYPRLGPWFGLAAGLAYLAICIAAATYLIREFEAIRIFRVGFWNTQDLLAGGVVALLVLEYTRRKYLPVFIVNVLLILYTVYGYVIPGMFHHPGISWTRVITASSLEMSTGVFERLAQLGLTLIGSFILVLSVLRGFDCIDSILKGSSRLAVRSPNLLPQSAVIGSFGVAAVSGSGAANAATTGTATIPALINAGFPRVKAAAVETASSLGGQLMPPLMGIAAFMMAEFMGVSYFEVVARGFGPAIIYFLGVSVAVYLLAVRFQSRMVAPEVEPMRMLDWVNIAAYLLGVAGLIYLMGFARLPALTSAQTVFFWLLGGLTVLFLAQRIWNRRWQIAELIGPFRKLVETFSLTTAELTVLLAALGILTAMFTVTGVPTKVGVLIMTVAEIHVILMVLVAFAFGYLVGMGLPVAPTYIIVAVVIAPFMIRAGIDPWVVHFFAFFVAVFGELSPPTSVTAAVTSRIADASFMGTMVASLGLCIPLLLMMAAVFTRPELVVEPGMAQVVAGVLVGIGCLGVILALQGKFHGNVWMDRGLRAGVAVLSLAALLHPDDTIAWILAGLVVLALAAGLVRAHRIRQERLAAVAQGS
ncbi:TRAP transporter large permease subunit [Aquisalimonas sp.]|uniref:TRAP transporter permease n=1 Tax=Aquisalimonas sp. TaxID=1872621 RepID=UPI0025BB55FB|nr:TRAP transporter large permease subunit [Aquisalimonas sp.]